MNATCAVKNKEPERLMISKTDSAFNTGVDVAQKQNRFESMPPLLRKEEQCCTMATD
jgi:hypothetical protein